MLKLLLGALCLSSVAVLPLGHVRATAESRGFATRADASVLGVFEGRTPCGRVAVEFTGFPAANCEKIKWEITLLVDDESRRPSGYVYRGTRTSRQGAWSIVRGAAGDPDAVVYRLAYGAGAALSLLRADDNVLLILNPDLTLAVGDASWSYTLSRTDGRTRPGP